MSFLRRLFSGGTDPPPGAVVDGRYLMLPMGSYENTVQTVGESHYQDTLRWACNGTNDQGPNNPRVIAELVPDLDNQYDPNAVRVQVRGRLVGHLSREDAVAYQPVLLAIAQPGRIAACEARIKGGYAVSHTPGVSASIGIELFVAAPEELAPAEGEPATPDA